MYDLSLNVWWLVLCFTAPAFVAGLIIGRLVW